MIKGIFGVNVAVRDLAAATAKFEALFGVRARALTNKDFAFPGLYGSQLVINGFHFNLIASNRGDTSIAKFVERQGEGLFLLSVEVDSIAEDEAELRGQGLELLLGEAAKGDFGAVNFVHPKSMNGVQIEIYQPARPGKE